MIPNTLTFSRIVLAAAFAVGVWAFSSDGTLSLPGLVVLGVLGLAAELTDILDGYVARTTGSATMLGGLLDPLSDSLSRLAVYFAMALVGWITIAVPLVMTGRDVIVAYTRTINAFTGGKTSARISGKFKAIVQGGGVVVAVVLAFLVGSTDEGLIATLRGILAGAIIVVTVWSLLDYVRGSLPGIRKMNGKRVADAPSGETSSEKR